ncbi:neogenin-like [Glandiceps talaboti]
MLQLPPFNTATKTIVVSVYELPRFASTNTPTVTVEATNATITWQKWIESTDIGDGPVEAYNVYYEQSGENNNWTMHHNIVVQDPSKTSYSTTITGLQWSTSYDFTVTVKRPGPKGEGSKDTFTTNITLCGVPDQGPIIRNATSSQPRIIRIDIEVPQPQRIKCNHDGKNGYIDRFDIRYREENSGDDYEQTSERDGTQRSLMLNKLRPYTEYEVQVRFINNNEASPWSRMDKVRTVEGAPSSPRNVTLTAALSNIIEIGWTTPEFVNGILDHYVVRYWGTGDEDNPMVENTTTDMYIIVNLQDNTNYSVQIAAVTGAGHGNYSMIHTIETKENDN